MKKIIPSIIATSQDEFDKRLSKVSFARFIQIDIMDGKFVKTKSFQFDFKLPSGEFYESHLMIKNPEEWIKKNYKKFNSIIFHYESTNDHKKIINLIKSKNKLVGIALNPETDIKLILPFVNEIDKILIMTVHPGKYGSKFIPSTLKKIKFIKDKYPKITVQVDGGINNKNLKLISKYGADEFVVGSYIQDSKNPEDAYKRLIYLTR
jgi:ribulose-phosphate 3-epimerase